MRQESAAEAAAGRRAPWVRLEQLLPDPGGHAARHQVAVVLGAVADQVAETVLPRLPLAKHFTNWSTGCVNEIT